MSAEFAVGADFARHARDFRRERTQLIDQRIDRFLELQNFAAHIHRDLAREIAVGDRNRHFGNVAHLRGEVARHLVDAFCQIFPDARHAFHFRLSAELAARAHLERDARYLRAEDAHLIDHLVDDRRRTQEFALQRTAFDFQTQRLRQIAFGHRGDRTNHFFGGPQQIVDEIVDRTFHRAPRAAPHAPSGALTRLAFLADDVTDAVELFGHALIGENDFVEHVGDLASEAAPVRRQARRKIAVAHRTQCFEHFAQLRTLSLSCIHGRYFAFWFAHDPVPEIVRISLSITANATLNSLPPKIAISRAPCWIVDSRNSSANGQKTCLSRRAMQFAMQE